MKVFAGRNKLSSVHSVLDTSHIFSWMRFISFQEAQFPFFFFISWIIHSTSFVIFQPFSPDSSFLWVNIHYTQLQSDNARYDHANVISNTTFSDAGGPRSQETRTRTWASPAFLLTTQSGIISSWAREAHLKAGRGARPGSFWNIGMLRNIIATRWINTTLRIKTQMRTLAYLPPTRRRWSKLNDIKTLRVTQGEE